MGTNKRTEYKVTNGVFMKRKVRLCVKGNQQTEGVHFQLGELYAPVMKAAELRLFVAIAAQHGLTLFKSDTGTTLAFLNGDISEEKISVRAPVWWPDHVPHGCALQIMKSV